MSDAEQFEDEISLRDLYLILLKGLPLIVAVSLLAGIAAFIASSFLPPTYQAESTTLVTPSPVEIRGAENISFRTSQEVSFESYETLAKSRPVLNATVSAVPEADLLAQDFGGDVSLLLGPQRPDQIVPMSVLHSVRSREPELAAKLADAWARSTLGAVQTSLLASLDPVRSATSEEISRLSGALTEVEARYESFQVRDAGETLEELLSGLNERITRSQDRRDSLERELAAARSQFALLLETSPALTEALSDEQLAALLEFRQARSSATAAETDDETDSETLATPEIASNLAPLLELQDVDLVTLLNRVELRDLGVELAGLEAEREQLLAQLEAYDAEAENLRSQIAALNLERGQLGRELENAQLAFNNVALLEPVIAYVTEVTPAKTRLLNEASVPVSPVGPRRTLNTALALVIAGMLATLFVFLREAVRAPEPSEGGKKPKAVSVSNLS